MKLTQKEIDNIVNYVQTEPRTVQDLANFMSKSWITAEKYIKEIEKENGSIAMKVFRKGSYGALKIVYYINKNSSMSDELKGNLNIKIKTGQTKNDFKFLDIYTHIKEENKKCIVDEYKNYNELYNQTIDSIIIFSGNLSFINELNTLQKLEELLKRKIVIKILCRVNFGSLKNLEKISELVIKYPNLIEIKHCYQPLRGLIIDDRLSIFVDEENKDNYKNGEIDHNIKIFYEIYDKEWNIWLKKIFWDLFRTSSDYSVAFKELKKIKIKQTKY